MSSSIPYDGGHSYQCRPHEEDGGFPRLDTNVNPMALELRKEIGGPSRSAVELHEQDTILCQVLFKSMGALCK